MTAAYVSFTVTALGLVVWPFASFVAIFIFDAPIRDAWDEAWRYALVLSVWGYPAFWGLGFAWLRSVLKRGGRGTALVRPCLVAWLPVLWVGANFVFVMR